MNTFAQHAHLENSIITLQHTFEASLLFCMAAYMVKKPIIFTSFSGEVQDHPSKGRIPEL